MLTRLRNDEHGFGMLELIISLTILNVGLLALVAAFNSGAVAIKRASQVATATALADAQMELYRGLKYTAIGLESGLVTTANGDTLYAANWPTGTAETTSCIDATKTECKPMQTVTGPDGQSYRIDSYVVTSPFSGTHTIKIVRVVVRNGAAPGATLVREESTFDASTGS